MLPPTPLLGTYLVAVLLICVTPGPDMIYILTHGISQGIAAALVAAFGMAIGMAVQTALVAGGLAAVLRAHSLAFELVRWGGAAYLAYMGFQALRHPSERAEIGKTEPVPLPTVLRRAAVTNLTNVKIILFYLAFLPQFVIPRRGHTALQLLILGLIFVVLGLAVDSMVAIGSGRVGQWLLAKPGASRRLSQVAGIVFLGLAAHTAI